MIELMTIHTKAFRMTDEEFVRFCEDNPDLRIERTPEKEIIIMSPNCTKTGFYHGIILARLVDWNQKHKQGFVADSSSGFFLPDNSVRMPDVSWISKKGWESLSETDKERFAHYCPDFVVEIKSKTDRLKDLQTKMESWISNGTRLAWLIDPQEENAWIYRPAGSVEAVSGFDNQLKGEEVLHGFTFDLKDLRIE